MNFDRLRFVAERAEVGEEREALFAVTLPEERGSFQALSGSHRQLGRGATQRHRIQLPHQPRATGARVHRPDHTRQRRKCQDSHQLRATGLCYAGLDAGRSGPRNTCGTWWAGIRRWRKTERLLRFTFPERPGALLRFLSLMRPRTGISACSTTATRAPDSGRILVGLQVPPAMMRHFRNFWRRWTTRGWKKRTTRRTACSSKPECKV